jgi:hypothetical protein
MDDVDTTVPAGHRRGRYALLAVIVALTTIGATAIVRGATHESPSAQPVATAAPTPPAPASSSAAAVGRTGAERSGALTTGPLLASSPPVRVALPTLRAQASVIGLGRQPDGSMQVPGDAATVGWYTGAPTPGALGPAILAGHVDFEKRPGTFAKLTELAVGDPVNVVRADDTMAMFTVTKVERYPKDRFPSAAVYGAIDHAGLRLITCGGDFDAASGHYRDNVVVYASLTRSHRL